MNRPQASIADLVNSVAAVVATTSATPKVTERHADVLSEHVGMIDFHQSARPV